MLSFFTARFPSHGLWPSPISMLPFSLPVQHTTQKYVEDKTNLLLRKKYYKLSLQEGV